MEGLSLSAIGRKFGISKEAVRQWIVKFEVVFAKKDLSTRKERDQSFLLDETKVKRNGRMVYVSLCLDLARREVVSTKASRSVGTIGTINLMESALGYCKSSKPMVILVLWVGKGDFPYWVSEYLLVDGTHLTDFGFRIEHKIVWISDKFYLLKEYHKTVKND